jgi:putative aminopeptidase FrvX
MFAFLVLSVNKCQDSMQRDSFSGGSDDGASCAIMLEILQIITQLDQPLKHNLILLFNGAEENLMQVIYHSLYCVW